jgi:hypothetical protein
LATAGTGGDVDAADLDAVHHLVEALAGLAAEDLAGSRLVQSSITSSVVSTPL